MGETDFLYARPSFLEGASRVLDVGATLQIYNRSMTPEEADAWALYKDFKAVGVDLRHAAEEFVPPTRG